jgi:lipoprotein-anchoring transpeptidase ErfK/SrfK
MTVRSRTETGKLKAQRVSTEKAIAAATKAMRARALWLGAAALACVVATHPAEAGKNPKKAPAEPAVQFDIHEPMIVVISVGQQKFDVYRGTNLVTTSAVSTGTAEHPTFIGAFSILEKQRWHHSNMYSAAPMPWMNRITWSGTALHAGVVPGYPASHGCIRLTYAFAPQFFQMSSVGDNVIVARGRPKPTPVEHPALFQPLPPPPLPVIGQVTPLSPRDSTSSPLPAVAAAASPVILAKAEAPTAVDSDVQTQAEPNSNQTDPVSDRSDNTGEDSDPNRVHAITPDTSRAALSDPVPDPATGTAAVQDKTAADTVTPAPPAAPASDPAPAAPIAPPLAAAKVDAGVAAAAVQAAEPRSEKPLRVLFTRRTQRDRIIGVQQILASMGYLSAQNFGGTIGKPTITAIKAFQKANGMRDTGAFNDELVKKVYEIAGKGEPPDGHLFVRQDLDDVFDAPVSFRNPDQPLGTHVYTALKFAPGDTKVRWVRLDVQDGDAASPLDRLEIPDDVRQKISERLTPGSTFIVADTSINSANLPKGGDFVVLAKGTGAKVSEADDTPPVAKPKPRRRNDDFARRFYYNNPWRNGPWFGRPW